MPTAACGHPAQTQERCWDCHLAQLRATGQRERAERLETIKRQHDEGRFDYEALMDGLADVLVDEIARRYDNPDAHRRENARRMSA